MTSNVHFTLNSVIFALEAYTYHAVFSCVFDDLKNLPYSDRLNKLKLWSLHGGEKESHGSDRTVQDGTRLVISSTADLLSAG